MHQKRVLILSIVIATLLAGGMIPISVLEVKKEKRGVILFHKRVAEGDTFLFGYIHSVEKTPVEGTFLVEEGGVLRIVETRFASYGAGLPNVFGKSRRKDGWFVVEGGERLDKLTFFFSQDNRPVLTFKGEKVIFESERGGEGRLEISIRPYPFLLYVFRELF